MSFKTEDYQIILSEDNKHIHISGVLRLQSPASYEEPFQCIKDGLVSSSEVFTIDISELQFLNSSGVSSLARLILFARTSDKEIKMICNSDTPWQKKTISSLIKLYDKLDIQYL